MIYQMCQKWTFQIILTTIFARYTLFQSCYFRILKHFDRSSLQPSLPRMDSTCWIKCSHMIPRSELLQLRCTSIFFIRFRSILITFSLGPSTPLLHRIPPTQRPFDDANIPFASRGVKEEASGGVRGGHPHGQWHEIFGEACTEIQHEAGIRTEVKERAIFSFSPCSIIQIALAGFLIFTKLNKIRIIWIFGLNRILQKGTQTFSTYLVILGLFPGG